MSGYWSEDARRRRAIVRAIQTCPCDYGQWTPDDAAISLRMSVCPFCGRPLSITVDGVG